MSFHVRPILSALLRNRTGAVLVSLQIAIALAVMANGVYIVKQRWDILRAPTGLDVENIFVVMTEGYARNFNHEAMLREDLAYLRSLDGIEAVTVSHHFPLSGSLWNYTFASQPKENSPQVSADFYAVDDQFIHALGARLIAGRGFRPDEVLPPVSKEAASEFVPNVIVSKRFADEMFPNQNAVGQVIYPRPNRPVPIIGVIDTIATGRMDQPLSGNAVFGARLPSSAEAPYAFYIVRTQPGQLDRVMKTAEAHLTKSNPNRVIDWIRTLEYFKSATYRNDRNMAIFLATVTGLLLVVTALGVFGLATFNVSTRTKQIGTRRALGARRQDIVRYFMVENWLVTTVGIAVGCALALVAGYALTLQYGLPRLSLEYLLGGVLTLWITGLAAAWRPARRAASISPAIATRTA
jgi:putative ABC transport system permease protein